MNRWIAPQFIVRVGRIVLAVAVVIGIPHMAIRCISDLADSNAEDVFGKVHRRAAARAATAILRMMEVLGSK